MKKSRLIGTLCAVVFSVIPLSSQAALVSVLSGQAVSDTDIGITWIADANLAASNTFGVSGINAAGWMDWATANTWIGAMNTANYLGFNDWRLPITPQTDTTCSTTSPGSGSGCTGSEMGHLNNVELITVTTPGLFSNFQNSYWSGEFLTAPTAAWIYSFNINNQGAALKNGAVWVLAVRSGTISPVPVPAAAWLFGSALLGLAGIGKRRKATQVIVEV